MLNVKGTSGPKNAVNRRGKTPARIALVEPCVATKYRRVVPSDGVRTVITYCCRLLSVRVVAV